MKFLFNIKTDKEVSNFIIGPSKTGHSKTIRHSKTIVPKPQDQFSKTKDPKTA